MPETKLDPTRPMILSDGTEIITKEVETGWFSRPSITVSLAKEDPTRKDLFAWDGTRNSHRSFFADNGEHVYDEGRCLRLVNKIDWGQPLELDDGTPVFVVARGEHTVDVRVDTGKAHPAFPIGKIQGFVRLSTGLVCSNHKYHVRNRTMTVKLIDVIKPLYITPGERSVPFITETSEGHILVGKAKDGYDDWTIYTKTGEWVRSAKGGGEATTLYNKPEPTVHYQWISKITGRIDETRHETYEDAATGNYQVVKVTSEDKKSSPSNLSGNLIPDWYHKKFIEDCARRRLKEDAERFLKDMT